MDRSPRGRRRNNSQGAPRPSRRGAGRYIPPDLPLSSHRKRDAIAPQPLAARAGRAEGLRGGSEKPDERQPGAGEVSSPDLVAEATLAAAEAAEDAVFARRQRSDRAVAEALRGFGRLTWADRTWARSAVHSLFRWHGWVSRLGLNTTEARLLVSVLLDEPEVPQVARVWARSSGVDPARLFALGDAPDWPALAEGLRRLLDSRRLATDPWLLFPPWLKEVLPVPPGDDAPKHRRVRLLLRLQRQPPLWMRSRTETPQASWSKLRELGLNPWVLRGRPEAARLSGRIDLRSLALAQRGEIVVEDLSAQEVIHACDPEPGERWWSLFGGSGDKVLHIADRMRGKGTVVVTDPSASVVRTVAEHIRKAGRSNVSVKLWDGGHLVGKAGTYQGVLLDAPGSGLGSWRRYPELRWLIDRSSIDEFVRQRADLLRLAAKGVKPGGSLIYSTKTITLPETEGVVESFLGSHPDFVPDPFPPFTEQEGKEPSWSRFVWPEPLDCEAAYVARLIRKGTSRIKPQEDSLIGSV